jgi:carbon-monoxide dehydrogenase large subunit
VDGLRRERAAQHHELRGLPAAFGPGNPTIRVHLAEYPSTKNPLGVKGIGESGTVPAAPAIISGIEDALGEYDVQIG